MFQQFYCELFFDGSTMRSNVLLSITDGRVSRLDEGDIPANAERLYGVVCPGFIDVQVNGGGGVQFNLAPTLDTLKIMSEAHCDFGTTSLMPTLITDDVETMLQGADAISQALKNALVPQVVGVHFEGPHLSTAKKGMHSATHIRPLGEREKAIFTRKDLGQVMVTVAPETVNEHDIRELVNAGVIVSLGHSNADYETACQALEAGASGFTHLYNAMSGLASRAPGMVGAALQHDTAFAGLIVDHLHVHPASASLAIKVKGETRLMLVTDAMAHAASDLVEFDYLGATVTRHGNKLTLADGTLAGSSLTMIEAVKHTHFDLQQSLESTLKMATQTPAAFLKLSKDIGSLGVGSCANFLQLDDSLSIQRCWINGKQQ